MSLEISDDQTFSIIATFAGRSFSTYDFVLGLQSVFPKTWDALEQAYGAGGQGAGVYYSSYSHCSRTLDKLVRAGSLDKLDYRPAPDGWGSPVIRYWSLSAEKLGGVDFPDEIDSSATGTVTEGAKQSVIVNRYERSRAARAQCIAKWGLSCSVCDFDFEKTYGNRGAGFIHVHHLKALREIGEEYTLDPVRDLRPVCPNCHAMIHRESESLSIEDLRRLMNEHRERGV